MALTIYLNMSLSFHHSLTVDEQLLEGKRYWQYLYTGTKCWGGGVEMCIEFARGFKCEEETVVKAVPFILSWF